MTGRARGRFWLTIRARITLSVALLVALGGGIIVTGLNLFMRYGPDWALPVMQAAPADPADGAFPSSNLSYSDTGVASFRADGFTGMQATVPAIQIRDVSDVLGTLLWSSTIALVAIVVLGSIAAWVLAGRVLSPLHEINAAARSATPNRLDRRVALRGPRDELTDLSDTLDEMLERLERAFRAQQLFAANASHELRTPLATEKAMLDMLLDGPEPSLAEYRAVAERLREVNSRSIAMGEALLELTRAQVGIGGVQPLEYERHRASDVLAEPLARSRARAAERDMEIVAEVEPHTVPVNPELMGRLLDNLLGNAVRHGRAGSTVLLRWAPGSGAGGGGESSESVLWIQNAAAPLDPETRERLHEPFVRGSGRVRAETGSGLGLAIATAVAQAHGGTLRVLGSDSVLTHAAAGAGSGVGSGADASPGTGTDARSGPGTGAGLDQRVEESFTIEVRLPLRSPVATLAP